MSDSLSSTKAEQSIVPPQHVHTFYAVIKRVINFIIILSFTLLLGYWVFETNQFYQNWLNPRTENPNEAVIQHYSRLLAPTTFANDSTKIAPVLASLANDERVIQASVYRFDATPIAQTTDYQPLLSLLQSEQYVSLSAHIGEILYDEHLVGFLRVVINNEKQQAKREEQSTTLTHQFLLLGLLGFILGGYAVKGFYSLRRRIIRK